MRAGVRRLDALYKKPFSWEEADMRTIVFGLVISGVCIACSIGYLTGQQPSTKTPASAEESADVAAIKQATQSFLKAFESGDAKAVAVHWTENGEYVADDGTNFRGRAAIEQAYRAALARRKGRCDAEVEVTSIRFPSRDTAVEEGYFKVRTGKEPAVTSRYSILHVRDGKQWLMAIVREWPNVGVSLRELDWLIGTWEARRDDSEIHTTYQWWGDKAFIRVAITLKQKEKTSTGLQMIGKDASTGQLRSWTFDNEGSFAEAGWKRDGNKWMQDTASVQADGSILVATNILTQIDRDTFTFQSVHRTLDGDDVDDIAPIRVIRVKGK
jgi:uncharacterized protein (TIGR02246 family)